MNEATPMDTLAASTGPLLGEGRLLANKVAIITGASRGIGADLVTRPGMDQDACLLTAAGLRPLT